MCMSPKEPSAVEARIRINGALFEVRHGLAMTVDQAATAERAVIELAYNGDGSKAQPETVKRAYVSYLLQQAWYRVVEGRAEPSAVATKREAIRAAIQAPVAGHIAPSRAAQAPRGEGPTKADWVRRGLLDGQTTKEIIAVVLLAMPEAKCTASTVAFYRHQLRQSKQLPPKATQSKEAA